MEAGYKTNRKNWEMKFFSMKLANSVYYWRRGAHREMIGAKCL